MSAGKKQLAGDRLRRPGSRRRALRRGPDRDARGRDQAAYPGARGPLTPCRWRHLPGASRGSSAARPHAGNPLAGRLRAQPPRVLDGRAARREILDATQQQGSAGSARTTSTAWRRRTRRSPITAGSQPPPMTRPILAVDIDGVISPVWTETEARSRFLRSWSWSMGCHTDLATDRATGSAAQRAFRAGLGDGWEDKANFYLPPPGPTRPALRELRQRRPARCATGSWNR